MSTDSKNWRILLHRNLIYRQIRARLRFFSSILLGIVTVIVVPRELANHAATRLLFGWNVGVCLYLLLAGVMIVRSGSAHIYWRSRVQDEGRIVVLGGTVAASIACMVAIFTELGVAKEAHANLPAGHVALAMLTIVSAWFFIHLTFALHYAHDYYFDKGRGGDGGLRFPAEEMPDYLDFLYFAFVIGTSGQTADVSFSSRTMRRTGLVHCVLAYLFNTTVLALTINVVAGLF